MEILEATEVQNTASLSSHQATAQKEYTEILRHWNVTSYSQLEVFHRCPRKFQLQKIRAAAEARQRSNNVDFSFGHAVGAGIQNYLAYGDEDKALLAATLAWSCGFFEDIPKKRKNLWSALIAVEKFIHSAREELLGDWDLLILPSGKPAIEVSFSLHCGSNGFKHYLHMDLALQHKHSGKLMVVDCKTTGMNSAEPANYANSSQALSYALLLEACLPQELVDYEVMYLVYSSTDREWTPLTFTKSALDQAEWIKDTLLTQELIQTYRAIEFFPKRGASCFEFFRRCEFFGECNLVPDTRLPTLERYVEAEQADYVIDLEQVIQRLKERKAAAE